MMTILPALPWPSTRYRMASGTSLNGKVMSMTGVTLPASMSSRKTCRRASLPQQGSSITRRRPGQQAGSHDANGNNQPLLQGKTAVRPDRA